MRRVYIDEENNCLILDLELFITMISRFHFSRNFRLWMTAIKSVYTWRHFVGCRMVSVWEWGEKLHAPWLIKFERMKSRGYFIFISSLHFVACKHSREHLAPNILYSLFLHFAYTGHPKIIFLFILLVVPYMEENRITWPCFQSRARVVGFSLIFF